MPWGIAGTGALLIGIGFSFLGMAQTWVSYFVLSTSSCTYEDRLSLVFTLDSRFE